MILKQKDSLEDRIRGLEQAMKQAGPGPEGQRYGQELAQRRAGLKGEQEAAYYIDFHLKDSQKWAVIHDLRSDAPSFSFCFVRTKRKRRGICYWGLVFYKQGHS